MDEDRDIRGFLGETPRYGSFEEIDPSTKFMIWRLIDRYSGEELARRLHMPFGWVERILQDDRFRPRLRDDEDD
jgi:hypothetical protein